MRTCTKALSVAVLLASAGLALADSEMVMLRDGTTGLADVTETEPDSVTISFRTDSGVEGKTVLRAERLDPACFYTLRSRYMDRTVENHVRLAVFCAQEGLFPQAKFQMDLARKLDPEVDAKIEARPEIMEGIAQRLADGAKRAYEKGDLQTAYELAQLIATRFQETPLAAKATEALDKLEAEMAARDAAEQEARARKAAQAEDQALRDVAAAREKVLAPIEARHEAGNKKNSQGLRANNRSTAKRLFESAAGDFQGALRDVEAARKRAGDDAELLGMLDGVQRKATAAAVNAWINAGNIELWRDNYNGARDAGTNALKADPGSAAAKAFLDKVDLARAMASTDWQGGPRPRR